MNKNNTYTDEAIVESFIGKDVRVTDNGRLGGIHFTIDGILASNENGYYHVMVGDGNLEGLGLGEIRFHKASVDAAWVAASGNIIRIHA